MVRRLGFAIAGTLLASPAASQAPAGQARFLDFFRPLVGTWPVHVLDVDAAGKVEYETTQLRDFRFTIGGTFVRETAIIRSAEGRQVEVGIHMWGYDRTTDRVLFHGFWNRTGERLSYGPHRIEGNGQAARLVGTMTTTEPDGTTVTMPSQLERKGDKLVWTTIGTRPDGSLYDDHVLTYAIAPVEVISAPPPPPEDNRTR